MNKFMLSLAIASAAPLAAVATPAAAQTLPAAVIIVVDMDQVFNTSAAGKGASAELKARAETLQARITSLNTQFGTEEQGLLKTRPTAPGPAATAWEAKARDLQTRKGTAEQELNGRNRDLQASRQFVAKQIFDAATPVIQAIMRERGATLVLPENATLQHAASIDVTTDVVARLDKALPRVSTTAPAAPK